MLPTIQTNLALDSHSIVIVIIGLIVAGVVGGKSLVESANLKRVIAETQRFKQAYNTFKLTYNYMPGDILMLLAIGQEALMVTEIDILLGAPNHYVDMNN